MKGRFPSAKLIKPNSRRVRQSIIVAYDGELTEDDYFRNWRSVLGGGSLTLVPIYVKSGGNALSAVEATIKKLPAISDDDEVWCVCDVDDAKSSDIRHAHSLARSRGINLALSVRSFETWIALHFERSARPIGSRAEAIELVKRHVPKYCAKNKVAPFDVLYPLRSVACANAHWLAVQGVGNPATSVHLLIEKLSAKLP